jgi:hypothetical protein
VDPVPAGACGLVVGGQDDLVVLPRVASNDDIARSRPPNRFIEQARTIPGRKRSTAIDTSACVPFHWLALRSRSAAAGSSGLAPAGNAARIAASVRAAAAGRVGDFLSDGDTNLTPPTD